MFYYLILISIISMLSSDIYLPALPTIQHALSTTTGHIQLTLSVYLLGISIGQLIYGPLSDSFGRKPVILLGTSIYILASLGCAFSPTIDYLIVCRLLQAIGVCACAAIWQSMVVDVYGQKKSLAVFSKIIPILSASPSLAPILGGYITHYLNWRWLFMVLTLTGFLIFMLTLTCIKETTTSNTRLRNHFHINPIFKNYKMLLKSSHFMGYIGIICLTEVAFFVYITGVPFLYKNYIHLTTTEIGFVFIPQTLVFMASGFLCHRLVHHFTLKNVLLIGIIAATIGSLFLLILTLTPPTHVLTLLVPFLAVAFANGIIYPLSINEGLRKYTAITGLASGFSGFLLLFASFIGTSIFSLLSAWGTASMAVLMLIPCILAFGCYRLSQR